MCFSSLVIYLSSRESLGKPLTLKICFGTSRSLYPFSINHFSRSLHLLLKDLGSGKILLRRRTCLCAISFLKWCGLHEVDWRYWWRPVGLTYKSVVTFPPIIETLTSKKLIEVWDHSGVNFFSWMFVIVKFPLVSLLIVPKEKRCHLCTYIAGMVSFLFHLKFIF